MEDKDNAEEGDDSQNSDKDEENEDDPDDEVNNWEKNFIKNSRDSFLQPGPLLEKVKLAMSRYGIKDAEPECYSILVDQTKDLMRSIVSELISTARLRYQDEIVNLRQARPGDTCDVKTSSYINERDENSTEGRRLAFQNRDMFAPRDSTPFKVICARNTNKEITYLDNQWAKDQMDKKEIREKVSQQKSKVAEGEDGQTTDANGGAEVSKDATDAESKQKGNRKKE